MLLLAIASAATIAAAPPAVAPRAGAAVQASASVRILSGERIRFEARRGQAQERPRRWRDTVFAVDGKPVDARFIEFE